MKISFLVIGYNKVEDTLKCLDSLAEFAPTQEVIFLDNNSSDNTFEIVSQRFADNPNFKLFHSETNLGVSGGRAFLLEQPLNDLVAFMDNDAFLTAPVDQDLIAAFEVRSVGIYGQEGIIFSDELEQYTLNVEQDVDAVSGYFQAFRKDLLKQVRMNQGYTTYGYEDLDFCMQVKSLGMHVKSNHKLPVTHIRNSSSSLLPEAQRKAEANKQLFKMTWEDKPELLEINRKGIDHLKCVHCGGEWTREGWHSEPTVELKYYLGN